MIKSKKGIGQFEAVQSWNFFYMFPVLLLSISYTYILTLEGLTPGVVQHEAWGSPWEMSSLLAKSAEQQFQRHL